MFTIIGGDGKEYGPATADQIRRWIGAGRANLDTKAKALGSEEWRPLADYPEFGAVAAAEPPPIPGLPGEFELADPWSRLGAWFADNVLAFLLCLPGFVLLGSSVLKSVLTGSGDISDQMSGQVWLGTVLLAIGGLILLFVQCWLLTTRGQTVGKRIIGVRIVTVAENENPGFGKAVGLRWLVPGIITFILNFVPPLGFIFFVVDSCFIFRADRRCIHDLIAGTKVVKV